MAAALVRSVYHDLVNQIVQDLRRELLGISVLAYIPQKLLKVMLLLLASVNWFLQIKACRFFHQAGHSILTGFRATKKPAHKCVPTSRKRIDLSLLRWRFHIHVTGFEIQSRNCPLHFSDCRQLGAIQKRRYFLDDDNRLHTRWRCPAFSRSLNKICENNYSVVVIDKLSLYII